MTLFRNVFEPNQPKHYQYPKSKYKETDPSPLAFQLDWYRRYPWLHYSVEKDAAFCFYCCKYLETHDISERVELACTVTGFRNWKRALESKKGFAKHQSSGLHKSKRWNSSQNPESRSSWNDVIELKKRKAEQPGYAA